jgi:hypothetical protein
LIWYEFQYSLILDEETAMTTQVSAAKKPYPSHTRQVFAEMERQIAEARGQDTSAAM